MIRSTCLLLVSMVAAISAASAANADEWTAVRLRGAVVQLVAGSWQPVHRGDAVPDETVIRTLNSGYVDFVRGGETVSLSPSTQIEIFDKGGAKPFTTVNQAFGQIAVEAEVENVQHFAVQTPYLAAVVKGTRFTVTSNNKGASVSVQRGHVEVDDHSNHTHTTISVGQSARTGTETAGALQVSGPGVLPPVLTANNVPVTVANLQATAAELAAKAKAAEDLAKQLKTPEAKAAADAAKKAADDAKKAADQAAKDADKAAKDAAKAAKDAAKDKGKDAGPGGVALPPPPSPPPPPPAPPSPPDPKGPKGDGGKGKDKDQG